MTDTTGTGVMVRCPRCYRPVHLATVRLHPDADGTRVPCLTMVRTAMRLHVAYGCEARR